MENVEINGTNFEVIAFYRTAKGRLISRMRVSPAIFEQTETGFVFDERVESNIKKNIIKTFAEKTENVEAQKIEFFLHEFTESEEEVDGRMETFVSTWAKYPIFNQ